MGRLNLRRRTLDPSICYDEELAELEPWAQLLFERLPMIADREGRLEDRPMTIKASIFPFSDFKIAAALEALARPRIYSEGGFILRYEAAGRKYIQIRNFAKYQRPHRNEAASEIPGPPELEAGNPDNQGRHSRSNPDNQGRPPSKPREATKRPDPDPDPDPDNQDPSRSSGEVLEKTSVVSEEKDLANNMELVENSDPVLELEPEAPAAALEASSNPFRFVVFWIDANAERDFGLRFEPEHGLADLVSSEVERLELEGKASTEEINGQVNATCEAFRSTYAKRTGRKNASGKRKTRGAATSPAELTETLVGWIRKDLARLAARSRPPARRGGLRNVDAEIQKSVKRGRAIDAAGKGKGKKWPPRKRLLSPSHG